MIKEIQGGSQAGAGAFAIVASRFNEFVTRELVTGACEALRRFGCAEENITLVHVPGAMEIPLAALKLAQSRAYVAIICVGAVIRGETPHFDYVAGSAAEGVMKVALETGIPVTFGLITADTMGQAMDRAGGKSGNKGSEAALAALEMANVLHLINTNSQKG